MVRCSSIRENCLSVKLALRSCCARCSAAAATGLAQLGVSALPLLQCLLCRLRCFHISRRQGSKVLSVPAVAGQRVGHRIPLHSRLLQQRPPPGGVKGDGPKCHGMVHCHVQPRACGSFMQACRHTGARRHHPQASRPCPASPVMPPVQVTEPVACAGRHHVARSSLLRHLPDRQQMRCGLRGAKNNLLARATSSAVPFLPAAAQPRLPSHAPLARTCCAVPGRPSRCASWSRCC